MVFLTWLLVLSLADECQRRDTTIGIYSESDFNNIKDCPCCDYALGADIVFQHPIVPIPVFTGSLYGQNHTLSNIRFDISGTPDEYVNCGIFGFLDQGTVAAISLVVSHTMVDSKIINLGTVAGHAYKPRLYMVNVTGSIDGTFSTPSTSSDHPHLDKGSSIGGIVGLLENENGEPITEMRGFVNISLSNTNSAYYPLNIGNFFGRFESDTPLQHFVIHWSSTMTATLTSNTTAYVGGAVGYCAADVVHATIGTNQTQATITGDGTPTLFLGGAFGSIGGVYKVLSWNKNTTCTAKTGTCVSGAIAGMIATRKAIYNLTFGGPSTVHCDALSCTTGGVIGSASAGKFEMVLFNGSVSCKVRDTAACGGVFGHVFSSIKSIYSYAQSVVVSSTLAAYYVTMAVGGLAGIIGGEAMNGEMLVINSSVSNVTNISGTGPGTILVGGFAGKIAMQSSRLIRTYSCAAYSDTIIANETTSDYVLGYLATAAGFVAYSNMVRYDFSYSYNTRNISAETKHASAVAGGFIGDGLETQGNHLMVYNTYINGTSAGIEDMAVRVGGFAGGLEGVALVRYTGAFSKSLIGTSTNQADLNIGGFVGIFQGAHSYGGFCEADTIIATANGHNARHSVGGFAGTLSGATSYVNGAWAKTSITATGPTGAVTNQKKGMRVGGFIGTMESSSVLNSTQAFGSITLSQPSSIKVGAMVGAAHTANISACMSNVTLATSQSDSFKMVGYSDGTINMDTGSMNFQVVGIEQTTTETNVTYLTWEKAKENAAYRNPSGSFYLGFNLNQPSRRQYLIKYPGEYPGLQVLPNPCSVDNPRWKQGNYCIFVEFNVDITLTDEYMDGKPFVAAHVAPDTCPDFSVCRGHYTSPLTVDCNLGFGGPRCGNCTSNLACTHGGTCNKPSGSSYGMCACIQGYKGVDCTYETCGGYKNNQCDGLGTCTYINDGFYVCACPSKEYYIKNQLCTKGCTGLTTGMCVGPPSILDRNILCPPGKSYKNSCGSQVSVNQSAYIAPLSVVTIIAVVALILLVLVSLGKLSFNCCKANRVRPQRDFGDSIPLTDRELVSSAHSPTNTSINRIQSVSGGISIL